MATKKRKSKSKHKLAMGQCKIIRGKGGAKRKFCRTGKGPTGYQFKA